MKKLTEKNYKISNWSGGTTTQLAIYPEDADYAKREFGWRISSATVELEHSIFTSLPDVNRILAPLEGELALSFNGEEPIRLKPLEQVAFSGFTPTESWGKVVDFNVMTSPDRQAKLETFDVEQTKDIHLDVTDKPDFIFIYCFKGKAICGENEISSNESLYMEKSDSPLAIKAFPQTKLLVVRIGR